jgi:hypothetical protein
VIVDPERSRRVTAHRDYFACGRVCSGFVVYTFQGEYRDVSQRVLEAVEFTNPPSAE